MKNLTESWDTALEKSEFEENLLIFDYLLQIQKCSATVSINSSKGSRRLACMSKELLTNVRHGKQAKKRGERRSCWRNIENISKHAEVGL